MSEVKNVVAARVSRILREAGFANGKNVKGIAAQNTFEVIQGGWKGKDLTYAQVFFEKVGESNHVEVFAMAKKLREFGYHVEVIEGEAIHRGFGYNAYWLNVLVENRAVAEAKKEIEKAKAQLARAEAKLAELMAA